VLTQSQLQASADVVRLLDTATDFLCFVTEFFEVISQSAPYIYQSALLFAPRSSVVWKLYGQYISSPQPKVVANVPVSWGPCTVGAGAMIEANCAAWSPCDQLIAIGWVDRVEIRNSITLLSRSILAPPNNPPGVLITPQSLAFSTDGRMLACTYHK